MTFLVVGNQRVGACVVPTPSAVVAPPPDPTATVSATVAAAPEAPPVWLERGRVPCLDGLRALSILLVLMEHTALASRTGFHGLARQIVGNMGGIGVDVFFAISGFLITLLLLREWGRAGGVSLKGFYARRFLRLMPAAIVFIAAVFALQRAGYIQMEPQRWLHVLTYTVNFDLQPAWHTGHLWSLSIEEQFYLFWPLALVLFGPRRLWVLLVVWLALAPLVRLNMLRLHLHDMGAYENWTPFRIDSIASGCLLALLAGSPEFRRLTRVSRRAAMRIMAAVLVVMLVSFVVKLRIAVYEVMVAHTVRAACITAMIWLTVNHVDGWLGRLLEWKPVVFIGLLSYSLYLWQQLFLVRGANRGPLGLLICLCLTFVTAAMSYMLIERPFLRLKAGVPRRGERAVGTP